ncbi:hypothetical protein [Sediminibacterium sp.]|uniref:hypothetical protein n=1 Tax=Sediminibacterium sp. TaxID=1917865 RepID=UPI00271DBABB|nr:hypothetical protein [Sediminibacterium sp.]MDO8997871.1 hypothetical protein [Sediminibacterium sp.]MDP1974281.1 hypothetical protein [Sediminibacterium sp.]MDP2421024.1 hypothetical protein [Sediminibacterium sp.]
MSNQAQLAAQSSLALIESMINKAQNRYSENGTLYLLWGWIIFICSLGHYALLAYTSLGANAGYIWMLIIVALVYQLYYLNLKEKKETVKTYTDEMIGYVWMVFGISMGLVSFIATKLGGWQLMYALILLLYGMPTFLTGAIMRFKPLKIGGVVCWCLSVLAVYISSKEIILLLIPAVISAWIIPGYILRAKFKNSFNG